MWCIPGCEKCGVPTQQTGVFQCIFVVNAVAKYETLPLQVDDALHGPYEMGAVTFVGRSPHSRSVINLCLKDNALCLHWNHLKLTADEHNTDHWVLLLAKVG